MPKSIFPHGFMHEPGQADPLYGVPSSRAVSAFQENYPRDECAVNVTLTAGTITYVYFTASQNQTVTSISTMCSTASSSPTLGRLGLYTVGAPTTGGTLSLVAQTADIHTSVWVAANTRYTTAFDNSVATSYALVRGKRYAVGLISVGGTGPALRGASGTNAATFFYILNPPLSMNSAGAQADLGSTPADPGVSGFLPWVAVG